VPSLALTRLRQKTLRMTPLPEQAWNDCFHLLAGAWDVHCADAAAGQTGTQARCQLLAVEMNSWCSGHLLTPTHRGQKQDALIHEWMLIS